MKHIKLYEDFKDIILEDKLKMYSVYHYTINDDETIDVEGDVFLFNRSLKLIPFKFGKVTGHFDCSNNQIESLEGCPYYVGGNFDCSSNKLNNLIGSPEEVNGNFECFHNEIKDLEGMPLEIGGNFNCCNNNLLELISISNIEEAIICDQFVDTSKFDGYCKEIIKVHDSGERI